MDGVVFQCLGFICVGGAGGSRQVQATSRADRVFVSGNLAANVSGNLAGNYGNFILKLRPAGCFNLKEYREVSVRPRDF